MPRRILDHLLNSQAVHVEMLEVVVLDEPRAVSLPGVGRRKVLRNQKFGWSGLGCIHDVMKVRCGKRRTEEHRESTVYLVPRPFRRNNYDQTDKPPQYGENAENQESRIHFGITKTTQRVLNTS